MITIRNYSDVERYVTIKKFFKRTLFNANLYRFGSSMFDTGISLGNELLPFSKGIKAIFTSHHHHDHVGNNALVQEQNGSTIYCHHNAIKDLESPDNSSFVECFFAGKATPSNPVQCPDSIEVDGYEVRPIYTPGHSNDHMCYYLPEKRYLFSGDLVLWGKTRWVSDEVNIYDAINSLHRISDLKIDVIFPGHGRPFYDPSETINEKISNLSSMADSVMELYEDGLSRKEIMEKLLGREELMAFLTKGRFSKKNLVDSFIDHRP
jgi:glyoxylase-like metal-dependent hydrolase (beta-lactamase superfamily II)